MTLADGIIVLVVALIVGLVFWNFTRKKDEGVCTKCSYAKTCSKDECLPQKKKSE
jgi:hypothetical protein